MPSDAGRSAPDVVQLLAAYLTTNAPRFLVISGEVGAGKSTLVRALYDALPGPKIVTLYQQPMAATEAGTMRPQLGAATSILLLDPQVGDPDSPAALAAQAHQRPPGLSVPEPLTRAVARLEARGGGTAVVDSWDRDTEGWLRGLTKRPEGLPSFPLPAAEFAALQSTLIGLRIGLVLALIPALATPIHSLADAVVELRREDHGGDFVRIVSVPKLRGSAAGRHDLLYTLEGGVFRSFPDLPVGFVPPVGAPEPDPAASEPGLWPGNAEFAAAFGRLRSGGLTALAQTPDCPDALAPTLTFPVVAHTLRAGGRVIWMPSPSVRPSRIVGLLKEQVPVDFLRERLRIVSPATEDPGIGDLRSVVLPLRRDGAAEGDLRGGNAPGVGPIFPDAYRFLRGTPEGSPSVYAMSLDGLKASAAAAGVALNPVTLPAVLAAYARLPRFHGFGYGRADDPLAGALLTMVTTYLHLRVQCGRHVVQGLRPRTGAYVLDWPSDSGRFSLVPCK